MNLSINILSSPSYIGFNLCPIKVEIFNNLSWGPKWPQAVMFIECTNCLLTYHVSPYWWCPRYRGVIGVIIHPYSVVLYYIDFLIITGIKVSKCWSIYPHTLLRWQPCVHWINIWDWSLDWCWIASHLLCRAKINHYYRGIQFYVKILHLSSAQMYE